MYTLRIEHPISNLAIWKAAFDSDPLDREGSGVLGYRIHRPADSDHEIMIDLDFEGLQQAADFRSRLESLWKSATAAPALAGTPQTWILEAV